MADTNTVRTLTVRQIQDASGYVAGAREFVAANKEMASSSSIVGAVVSQTQAKISNAADPISRLVRAYDPASAAAIKFNNELSALNKQLEAGKIGAEAASRIYAGMVNFFGTAANGADLMAQGFVKIGAVVSSTNQEILEFRQTSLAIAEASASLEQMSTRAAALKAQLDPVGTSQARLNTELAEYNTLLKSGLLNLEQFTKLEIQAKQRHDEFAASLNRTPQALNDNNAQFRRQNLAYQGFDIGQGLASGMPIGMIAAQQSTQIIQPYIGPGGGLAAVKADAIAARVALLGLTSAIGPLGLAFAGATIVAGAFYLLTRKEAKTTDQVLKEHAESIKALGDAYGVAEEKAKKYSDADRAIALAAENKSAAELAQKQKDAIASLTSQFSATYNARTPGFGLRADLANFAAPFNALRSGTATVEEFVVQIQKIGEEKGMQKQAQDVLAYAKELKLVNDQMLEHIRLQELVKFPNLNARTDEAAAQAKLRIQNADDLANMQRQHAADLASIGARSPTELAAAARAKVMAEPLSVGEDQTNRQYRANAAAALAYAQAEEQLGQAKDDRQRQSQAQVEAAQYELSLMGRSVAERNRLMAAYQAEAQIREAAARSNIAADESEIASARAKATAIADANAKLALGNMVADQGYDVQRLQLEANLIGATAEQRARATAALEAEIRLKQQGIDVSSQAAQGYIAEQEALAKSRVEIERQNAAYQSLQQAEGSAIDTLITGTGSASDRLKSLADDAAKWALQMSVANPLKNAWTNTNLPTITDLFSGKPSVPGASSTSTAMMNVQATTVMINGGVPGVPGAGGLAGLLGLNPANSNIPAVSPVGAAPVIPVDRLPLPSIIDRQDGYAPQYGNPLGYVGNYKQGVDPRLSDILNQAALRTNGYQVQAFSGYRPGDPRFHGQGLATDVRLIDPSTGQALSNYQDPATFRAYEQFAQNARTVQMQNYPELNDQFRWGGYFSGPPGKYGAMDQMHFDLGGSDKLGMAGGTWERGLNPAQRSLFPGVNSQGMNTISAEQANSSMLKFSQSTNNATKDLSGLGDTSSKLGTSLTDALGGIGKQTTPGGLPSNYFPPAPTAPPTGGGFNPFSIFTSLFSLFGFADGTDFSPGGLAWVGERGRELVNLPRGSKVTPNHKLNGMGQGGGGNVKVDVGVSVDNDGNLKAYVKSVSHSAANEAAASHSQAAIQSYNDNVLPGRVQYINQNPWSVG